MNQVLDMDQTLDVGVDGYTLVTTTLLNKGTAFKEAERDQFGLHGPLPPHIGSLEDQSERRLGVLRGFAEDIQNYVFLRDLQDTNETLFYAVLTANR